MTKLEDLQFESHSAGLGGTQAKHYFPNDYGVSVITGEFFHTSDDEPYEVAILDRLGITYSTPLTDDVLGYQTAEQVQEIMDQVAALPAKDKPQ